MIINFSSGNEIISGSSCMSAYILVAEQVISRYNNPSGVWKNDFCLKMVPNQTAAYFLQVGHTFAKATA